MKVAKLKNFHARYRNLRAAKNNPGGFIEFSILSSDKNPLIGKVVEHVKKRRTEEIRAIYHIDETRLKKRYRHSFRVFLGVEIK